MSVVIIYIAILFLFNAAGFCERNQRIYRLCIWLTHVFHEFNTHKKGRKWLLVSTTLAWIYIFFAFCFPFSSFFLSLLFGPVRKIHLFSAFPHHFVSCVRLIFWLFSNLRKWNILIFVAFAWIMLSAINFLLALSLSLARRYLLPRFCVSVVVGSARVYFWFTTNCSISIAMKILKIMKHFEPLLHSFVIKFIKSNTWCFHAFIIFTF